MGKFGIAIASLGFSATAWAQAGAQIDTQVVRDFDLIVEHPVWGPIDHVVLAANTAMTFPAIESRVARSGMCALNLVVRTVANYYGNAAVLMEIHADLPTIGYGQLATASTGGEFVFTLRAPQTTDGMLWIGFDTTGSYGPTTLGDLFVDVGDDSVLDAAAAGQCNCTQLLELPITATPAGVPIRVTHTGNTWGTTTEASAYHIVMSMAFIPGANPIRPLQAGCAPLHFNRLPMGVIAFDFTRLAPAGSVYFLVAGAPQFSAVNLPGIQCGVSSTFDATVMVPGPFAIFPFPQLPPGGSAAVQGFVFQQDSVLATDSWLVN